MLFRSARAEAELATAANIHSQLVPDLELSLAGWRLAGKSVPSAGMGGDLLDAVARDDGGLDVVLVDVSGHGTRAGVVMAVVKAAIRASLLSRESISQVAADANRVLCDVSPNDMFATACFVRTGAEGRVDMVVAGHPPALIAGPGGVRPVECEGSLPLGIRKSEAFEAVRLTLEQGESLVLYSDGVIEAGVNKLGIEDAFGDARLRAVVADACKSREPKPSAVNGAVFMSVEAHAPPEDDVSVLTLCRETA